MLRGRYHFNIIVEKIPSYFSTLAHCQFFRNLWSLDANVTKSWYRLIEKLWNGSTGTQSPISFDWTLGQSEYFHLNSARKLLASPPLTTGWSSDSRSALFRHGGDRASSSRRAISTFTVSRPPIAVAWLIACAFGYTENSITNHRNTSSTKEKWISSTPSHI